MKCIQDVGYIESLTQVLSINTDASLSDRVPRRLLDTRCPALAEDKGAGHAEWRRANPVKIRRTNRQRR